ncbi:MAG: hypothetical protein B6242_00790 [Anaerolineaceae bacterium 4572_78]|nr:MAG: hypothetical protein B6242_00790 [Anaerolineaceae bacterium 4572_78]
MNKIKYILQLILFLSLLTITACDSTASLIQEGNQAFDEGDYETSAESYQNAQVESPDLPEPYYNAGNSFYRQEDYEKAELQARQALRNAEDDLAQNGYYNLGNTLYNIQQYEQAIEAYKEALRINPTDHDSKHNLELALRQLQQQQQEQQQQDESDDENDENQDEQESESDSSENDENDENDENQDEQESESDSSENDENEQNHQSQPPQADEHDEDTQPQPAPQVQALTPEQAEQLLEAISQDTKTLQQFKQIEVPSAPSDEDW